ncbi:hypothetical protein KSS87_010030 [Heliosperma pusillum]|nr:hypothetical protein KSS87_010030 [Heliosperma pusillum]
MQTMGNEGRHKELQCKQWVMKEDSMFTQGVTMQTMGNEERKTHCSHKELQCKQWVMKEDSLFTQGVTMQ